MTSCWGVTRERKGGDHTLAALKSIRARRPGGYRLYVILDNLSANKTPAIRTWAAKANVELCFTPTNASWANPIEAQFGPIRTFVIGGSDHPNHHLDSLVGERCGGHVISSEIIIRPHGRRTSTDDHQQASPKRARPTPRALLPSGDQSTFSQRALIPARVRSSG